MEHIASDPNCSLRVAEWEILFAASLTVLPVLELAKWMERREWLGKMD